MQILVLTSATGRGDEVLPALGLLSHAFRVVRADAAAMISSSASSASLDAVDLLLIDARSDLAAARSLCKLLTGLGVETPKVAAIAEGSLVALDANWGLDDFVLVSAGPAEADARFRLAVARRVRTAAPVGGSEDDGVVRVGALTIEEHTYTARLRGNPLDLTYKEFELLKFLAHSPSRVFSRVQLLQEVWGYDYYGGTRTVDVHVRRLRAKLGPEHESFIGTVRNVGYKFVPQADRPQRDQENESEPTEKPA